MQEYRQNTGLWTPESNTAPAFSAGGAWLGASDFRRPAYLVQSASGHRGVGLGGRLVQSTAELAAPAFPLLALLPPIYPEWLGDPSFHEAHGTRFSYVAGAMANGIATTEMVIEMARAGMLGFFGAAGLSRSRVETAIDELERELGDAMPWGANLIHSPHEPALEEAVADLYIERSVRRVSAAAYLGLTPYIVRYACHGLHRDAEGRVLRKNHVFAKVSHPQTAAHFMRPAPAVMLKKLVAEGKLTQEEALLARSVAVAEDITAEADSGGHTDNRPLTVLLPSLMALRDEICREQGYARPIRVGAAGGLGTPAAVASAYALGAAYVVTGSVNQACIESGLDASGKEMLAKADIGDVVMAPAADMFEMGVEVQVLKHGTMFAARAAKLYELYKEHSSLEEILASDRERVESQILRESFTDAWAKTRSFWIERDPREVSKAEASPKHLMALVFRSYLGQASRWAIAGHSERRVDFQIWCGPAMGAFNRWARGSFLEAPKERRVAQVALNLLEGAAQCTRAQQLRSGGLAPPSEAFDFRPRVFSLAVGDSATTQSPLHSSTKSVATQSHSTHPRSNHHVASL
ncbi:MAG: PfaD family polyunsaturated fatty acid/polyketide biosynthesis protein [Myxococcales bacterium]|nr:PfaD family polyunsaturated fatty acid/polyketide biosynthesis protein [Myxococcales bacterium]